MYIVYFVIAVVALAGAATLLWLDRRRSSATRHQRAQWGDAHGFKFRESDSKLRKVFHRATMNVPDRVDVQDVAYGHYGGAEAVVFDLAETATVIAVRRSAPSSVVVDLRHEDVFAPAEDDVELLGAMGQRVMFSNNLDAARRVCDRRMVTLATKAPAYIEVLWNEGNWALGSLPLTNDATELDTALEVVRRFADLLRVLPPMRETQEAPDPRDPHGPARAEFADEKTDHMRDKDRGARVATATRDESGRDQAAPTTPRPSRPPIGPRGAPQANPRRSEASSTAVPWSARDRPRPHGADRSEAADVRGDEGPIEAEADERPAASRPNRHHRRN